MSAVPFNSMRPLLLFNTQTDLQTDSEIAELMSVKSKYGAGGEYSPEWKPKASVLRLSRQIVIESVSSLASRQLRDLLHLILKERQLAQRDPLGELSTRGRPARRKRPLSPLLPLQLLRHLNQSFRHGLSGDVLTSCYDLILASQRHQRIPSWPLLRLPQTYKLLPPLVQDYLVWWHTPL
jgi:hypothetical protein